MKLAGIFRSAVVAVFLLILAGCVFTEQLIPAVIEERRDGPEGRVEPAEFPEMTVLNADWYNTYLSLISGLTSEELADVLRFNQEAFAKEPSDVNKAKLLVSLMLSRDVEVYKNSLSLIGDSYSVDEEATDEWQFFIETYLFGVRHYQALLSEKEQIVSKVRQKEIQNKAMKNQLAAERSERKKLENQLKQLKFIEASLIQRDIREDTPSHE